MTAPPAPEIPRIQIYLDINRIWANSREEMWATLLHEMIHAYIKIVALSETCGGEQHCRHFIAAAEDIADRMRRFGMEISSTLR